MRALLVIDMQIGGFAGQPPRLDQHGTVRRINALAQAIRPRGLIVFIQHTDANEGYPRGSEAWQLLAALDREAGDALIEKTACDSFLETELDALLKSRGVTELVITGCATDFCVDTTVRSAAARGYQVIVPSDGHTTRDRPHLSALQVIAHHNYMWADLLLPR
ncbi:MAG TPA: cysteine hydrolase family protein, partial [Opitutus sp.]|nr:cysteine hydrolase family protein [Opitutus sp.]